MFESYRFFTMQIKEFNNWGQRAKIRLSDKKHSGPIIYWMQREQRVHNNWALLYAQKLALDFNRPLIVVFCLMSQFLNAQDAHFQFMIQGLRAVEQDLKEFNIPFVLLQCESVKKLSQFIKEQDISYLVADVNPLHLVNSWKKEVYGVDHFNVVEVDAHNIVPIWHASPKQEFAAYTIRPKIRKLLPQYLIEFPKLISMPQSALFAKNEWPSNKKQLLPSGETAALQVLQKFTEQKFVLYEQDKNDPNKNAVSGLSPYLHFGQISSQRVVLELMHLFGENVLNGAFVEELVVRKELADNFCYYNSHYDSIQGFPDWAKKTLAEHWHEPREYVYNLEQWIQAETHDPLWNACQHQLSKTGTMHGYMRMYWAKKILEYSKDPETAQRIAISLNDKYALDGRDPNGYTGIAWSIGGVHDRAWPQRAVFGKIRYMNYNGAKRKFDVDKYMETWGNNTTVQNQQRLFPR